MARKEGTPKRSTKKVIVSGVVAAARSAKSSAKAVLLTGRTLPPPVELEPRIPDMVAMRALERERQRLRDELRHQELVEQEHPTTGNHMADDATEVSEQAKTLALRRHLEGMLQEIDRAIVRAQRGMYGVCERCGKSISKERLQVMPSASLCIECAKLQARSARAMA